MNKYAYLGTRFFIFGIVFILLSACVNQKNIEKDFVRIAYPGELTLYYSQKPAKEDQPFIVLANDKEFHIYGEAVRPSIQSMFLLDFLLDNSVVNAGDEVLDIGTGSGIQAVFAADTASRIVATDIGKDAIKSAKMNIKRFGLEKNIDVRLGDLFAPVNDGEKFDVIINNINYPEEENNQHHPLWDVHERFFKEVSKYLKHDGKIIYESGFLFNFSRIQEMVKKNGLQIMEMKMKTSIFFKKEMMVYVVKRKAF